MAFPDDILAPDEEVVVHLHPHWVSLIVPALWTVAALVFAVIGVFFAPGGVVQKPIQYLVLIVALGAIAYLGALPWLRQLTTHYVVTNRRLVIREGVVTRSGHDVPLARLIGATIAQSLFEQWVGSGRLIVDTGGQRGRIALSCVPHVERVQETLGGLAARYQAGGSSESPRRGGWSAGG
ncbi:PH domain-containing protein [Frankia sp. AiPa1]|uniref:PH domain-containing protein n=1 Tax=Frankia sp. AiPa1 TaxID=573492 RepID=UPI00202AC742|nr:PH domain-containing protein [Frankia sp. AiPa1]MCL9757706.1 PH domain-containing protein [Frankia sp. AiPa1]